MKQMKTIMYVWRSMALLAGIPDIKNKEEIQKYALEASKKFNRDGGLKR